MVYMPKGSLHASVSRFPFVVSDDAVSARAGRCLALVVRVWLVGLLTCRLWSIRSGSERPPPLW